MIRRVYDHVWAFDLEWAPDPVSGRRVYNLPPELPDLDVIREMWAQAGATPETPQPYLKTALCRIVSVAFVRRRRNPEDSSVQVSLHSLPTDPSEPMGEAQLINQFFRALGTGEPPQLVGFNSRAADVPILVQRGLVHGLSAAAFCRRRGGNGAESFDYFARYGDAHLDLKDELSGWGVATPKLAELAAAAGIPGKLDTRGDNVVDLWLAGNVRGIVEYNQFDALTTYLLWLRTARFAGLFDDEQFATEEARVRELIERRISQGDAHLQRYRDKWAELAGE